MDPTSPTPPNFYLYPTLLRNPTLPHYVDPDHMFTWPDSHTLPLDADLCAVEKMGDEWVVWVKVTREAVYRGPGPVDLVPCPVPF